MIMRAKMAGGLIWSLTLLLVMIALLAAARRVYVLLDPPQGPPRFAAAAMDAAFAQHKSLTLAHIVPASLFTALMPLQFARRISQPAH